MAQKKITELQLIAAVIDALNFPGDDGIQSYRATAAQLATYMSSKLLVTNAIATAMLQASSVTTAKIADANVTRAKLDGKQNILSKTSNYTLTTTDDIVFVDTSGGAFTLTLPTAVGADGKRYKIIKTENSSNALTLATTSSQTIGGSTTRKMHTLNESWHVVSDGTNWQIIGHRATTAWASFTPTFTGFGTVSTQASYWRRKGSEIEVSSVFTVGTPTATEARVSLPNSWATASTPASLTTKGSYFRNTTAVAHGGCLFHEASVAYFTFGEPGAFGATNINVVAKQNGSSIIGAGNDIHANITLPINGWDD